jgi:hypothetical protein
MAEPGPFGLETVVVGPPKRSRWRRYTGPDLVVSAANGVPLAHVTYANDGYAVLTKTSGEPIVRIDQFEPMRFRFTDAADQEVGTAAALGHTKTRKLSLRAEQGRRLFLTRPSLLNVEWQLTETDPDGGPAPEILGRVTVGTSDSWIGSQQYVVEAGAGLDASERRAVVASVVRLHLLRRPPGGGIAPA